jgi:hypothetical protein
VPEAVLRSSALHAAQRPLFAALLLALRTRQWGVLSAVCSFPTWHGLTPSSNRKGTTEPLFVVASIHTCSGGWRVSGEHAAFGGVTNVNEHVTGSCMHTLQTWTSSHEGMREVQPTGWLVGAILARIISGGALATEALLASIHSVGGIIAGHQLAVHVQSSSLEPAMKLVGVCRCMRCNHGSTSRRRQRLRSAYRRRAVEHASLRRQAGVMRTGFWMGFRPRSRWCLMQYCAPEPSLLYTASVSQPSCWHGARCNGAYCQMFVPSQRGMASLSPATERERQSHCLLSQAYTPAQVDGECQENMLLLEG